MLIDDALNINRRYLEEIDKFIKENYQSLKCSDIAHIYFQLWKALKEFRGTSSGFTGLSELLIFRFLYHQLGGSFRTHDVTHELKEFISESHPNLRLGQGTPINIDKKRRVRPDISIHYSEDLKAIIQIKVYLTNGVKEVDKEMKIIKELKIHYPKLQALLIVFSGLSKKGKIFRELEKQKNIQECFNFLILKENKELLIKKLQQYLDLQAIITASSEYG